MNSKLRRRRNLGTKENEMTDITIEVKEESSTCCGGGGQCGCKKEEKAEVKTETSCCGGNC
jgi:hypothetical protein